MPGAIKQDHLQPVEPLLSGQFFNFFTFILGSQFLLPHRANLEKRENLPATKSAVGFQCYGAFKLDHLEKGNLPTAKLD